ncbi:MAG: glycerophosphodiester phosphodiesterase [Oscillospiraceae bacterium]|jgi:glycerophosphoryl diester phosphodiesterase|nr:glycerophosphodiester phosphodiesterase [Oscillospiraceae bacterium]
MNVSPKPFAHRGAHQFAPENTIGAFQGAVDNGIMGIECDIHLTKDGVPVVVHDGNLTRLTCGHPTKFTNARIRELTADELRAVELPYANHCTPLELPGDAGHEFLALRPGTQLGQGPYDYIDALARDPRMASIPTFTEFLDWLAGAPAGIEAEIELCDTGTAKPVYAAIAASSVMEKCIVFSGNPLILMEMGMNTAPEGLRLGANIRRLADDSKAMLEDLPPLWEVGLNPGRFTKADVEWLNAKGIQVLANLCDTFDWWEEMQGLGLYGFKTNYAPAYRKWAEGRV